MTRLKFLLFAIVVLGIWLSHLKLIAPLIERAVEIARARASAAPVAVESRAQQRRAELQTLLLKALNLPSVAAAAHAVKGSKLDSAASEKLAIIRADLKGAMPPELGAQLIIGIAGESVGSLSLSDDGERMQGLDLSDLADRAGADGVVQEVAGTPFVFYSAVTGPGRLILGAPALPDKVAESVALELDLPAVVLFQKSRVTAVAGPEKATAELLAKNTRPGKTEYIKRGPGGALGPIALPLFAGPEGAPLLLAVRRPTKIPSLEVVSVVSTKAFVTALSEYESLALWIFGGLFLLTGLVAFMLGLGKAPRSAAEGTGDEQAPEELGTGEPIPASPMPAYGSDHPEPAFLGREPITEDGMPGAGVDDGAALPFHPPPLPPPDPDELDPPTRAYPALMDENGADSAEPAQSVESPPPPPINTNPEDTRLAPVPEELLRATAEPHSPPASPETNGAMDEEKEHLEQVYRDFVGTRRKCGEPGDGLNFEKFASKLRKNRDQLVEKYSCRTVRFHVYVKEGKAALKATPIRE